MKAYLQHWMTFVYLHRVTYAVMFGWPSLVWRMHTIASTQTNVLEKYTYILDETRISYLPLDCAETSVCEGWAFTTTFCPVWQMVSWPKSKGIKFSPRHNFWCSEFVECVHRPSALKCFLSCDLVFDLGASGQSGDPATDVDLTIFGSIQAGGGAVGRVTGSGGGNHWPVADLSEAGTMYNMADYSSVLVETILVAGVELVLRAASLLTVAVPAEGVWWSRNVQEDGRQEFEVWGNSP